MKSYSTIITLFLVFSLISLFEIKAQSTNSRHAGVYNISEIGYLSASNTGLSISRFRTIFGYFISPQISTGVGFGLESYQNPIEYNMAPLFLDVRGYLKDAAKTPFVFINLGKSVALTNLHENGLFVNLGLGYQKNKLIGSIGYNRQRVESIKGEISINSLSISLGLLF